ncbi:MAG: tRNA (adenosine(37)-N6)-threonylcarbamoyltransferase complex dimerization subunit type 1 TsaB [Lewinella sp.]|nr:tRNA (adenosine(37)-N6)-threonylcarbamoyltransferase complex dimerization subunit type 1 TsaB [Lewinella sp.]
MLLLLETATDICSIGISREDELLSLVEIDERADHAARINELILQACREAVCTLKDIQAVALSKGPGSYTSLRVGTATAKGICYALNLPLIAVDTLTTLIQASMQEGATDVLYCPMIDARRMEVYTAWYDTQLNLLKPPHPLIIEADTFAEQLAADTRIILSGNGAPKCRSILPTDIEISPVVCSAAHLVSEAHRAFREQRFEDIAYFEPLYLKPPNITKPRQRL